MAQTADKVYRNAKIYSIALDGTETHAQALAIKDGKFAYIGDDAGVGEWIGDATEVVDCNGKSVIPGLGDAHLHNAQAAQKFGTCSFSAIMPNPEKDTPEYVIGRIQETLKAYAEEHKDAPVIRGLGWDRAWFNGGLQGIVRPFTRHDIDAVIPDKPVVLLSFCGHLAMLNTKALEAAGVTKDIDDLNGLIVREADGSPSGYISEPVAFRPIIFRIPGYEFTPEEHHECQKKAFAMMNELGFTLMCDCQQAEAPYTVLTEMAKNGEFTARISGVHNVNDATREEDMEKAIANRTKFDVGDLFTVNTVKYFADGSLSMIELYADTSLTHEPGTREPLLWDEEHMMESMARANKEGFNIHTHAMGSYAIRRTIDCYENAQKLYPNPDLRNIIAHCTFIDPADRVRMGKSHIIASNQPGWFSDSPEEEPVMVADWGEDVVKQTYPSKSLIDNGVVCAYGSDFPVNAEYGLSGIQVAMTRKCVKVDLAYERYKDVPASMPEECISLKEALKAHTIHPAFQAHLENITGSIEVGKSAELVVLDSDIESIPVEQIQDIKVLETVFMGNTVFKANAPVVKDGRGEKNMKADKIIYGNIYTVDRNQPKAAAAAIADGRFVYVGDEAGAKAFMGEDTAELRYESGMILPGLGEGHGHVTPGGTEALFQARLYEGKTLEEYRAIIREQIKKQPDSDVIQGTGFLMIPDFEPNGPTTDMLDGLTDKPICLADAGHHSYWVNHAGMERMGVNKDTPDVSDGIVVRDDEGNPTGWFREGAMDIVKPLTPYSVEQYKEAILYYQEEYLANGETLFFDPILNNDGTDNATEAYHQLDIEGKLHMHAYGGYQVFQAAGHDPIAEIEHAAKLRERTRGKMFDLSNIKVQVDGVIEGKTAYMKEPYCDPASQENHNRGQLRFDVETLTAVFKRAHELGFTVHVHAIGDGALAMTLDAMEKALAQTGPHDFRDAITHLQAVDLKDIPRMAKLNVVASTDPHWFDMDDDYFAEMVAILGEERAEAQMPMKSFFDAGVVVTSASDYAVTNPAYPLIAVQKGVTRCVFGDPDTVHNAAERVTVAQMIEAVTRNEAYQFLCDERLGSITAGKEADLVVLGTDITTCDPDRIHEAPVLGTMVGGEWVYTRRQG